MGHLSSKPISSRCSGFTFLEVVIAMVIVGILGSALARFVDFDAANKAAADLGYQSVEARWKTIQVEKISDTVSSKSTAFPSLADLSGYVEASASEPAPDTAPMLVDWTWNKSKLLPIIFSGAPAPINGAVGGYILSSEYNDESKLFRCSNAWDFINPLAANGNVYIHLPGVTGSETHWKLNSFSASTADAYEDVPATDPSPRCTLSMNLDHLYRNHLSGTVPLFGARGKWTRVDITGASESSIVYDPPYSGAFAPPPPTVKARPWEYWPSLVTSPAVAEMTPSADQFRYDCSFYSQKYGVPYRIKDSTPGAAGAETGAWTGGTDVSFEGEFVALTPRKIGDGRLYINKNTPSRSGVCERVGPAPAVPPATDGNPGNPPPKADFSGLCVAKGWSVATFKADGSPTSAATDLVARISSPTEDSSCE